MIASSKGYLSMLEVHLDTVTVTSSLNDIRLLTAETCRVRFHLEFVIIASLTFSIDSKQSPIAAQVERYKTMDVCDIPSSALFLPSS